jgi:hypothetical protein
MNPRALLFALLSMLTACSATPVITVLAVDKAQPDSNKSVVGSDRSEDPSNSSQNVSPAVIPGIPFRVPAEQVVRIFKWNPEKEIYEEQAATRQVSVDYTRLYAINVSGEAFASPALHITENPDNTLQLMNVTSSADASAANAVGTAASGVLTAKTTQANNVLTAQTNVATAQKALRDAVDSLAGLASDATAAQKAAYQATVNSAQQQLNSACAAAAALGSKCAKN